jgi:hypothetical protein
MPSLNGKLTDCIYTKNSSKVKSCVTAKATSITAYNIDIFALLAVRGSCAGVDFTKTLMLNSISFKSQLRKSLFFPIIRLRFLSKQVTVNNKRKLRKKQKLQKRML